MNCLEPQTSNLLSIVYNIWGIKTQYGCIKECGVVVEKAMRETKVTSSNPIGRVAHGFYLRCFCVDRKKKECRVLFGTRTFVVCPHKRQSADSALSARFWCVHVVCCNFAKSFWGFDECLGKHPGSDSESFFRVVKQK